MIKRKDVKVVYSIDAHKSETKKADITVEYDAVEGRITFMEKGKPMFYVSACDANSLAERFNKIHKGSAAPSTMPTLLSPMFMRNIIS